MRRQAAGDKRSYGVLLVAGGRTHQENYAPWFAADPRCRLVALTDEPGVPAERARWNRELAAELGVPYLEDLDAALARADVDIASVCAEPERRGRLGARCARAGKHVYLDKPLAGSLEDADALVEAVRSRGVRSQMFSLLRTPWARRARRIAQSGALGDLVAIHCDLLFAKGPAGSAVPGPRKESYPPRRFTFVDSKRELFTTGVYSLGLLRSIARSEVRRVEATTENYFFAEHQRNDVEDFGAALLVLQSGAVGSITAGRVGWTSHPAAGVTRLWIVGTRASAWIDAYRPRVEVFDSAEPWRPPPRNPDDPMGFWASTRKAAGEKEKRAWAVPAAADVASDVASFLDCVEAGRESDLSAADGRRILEVLFACYRSAAERRAVEPSELRR
jgi:predicted dehydrogenase